MFFWPCIIVQTFSNYQINAQFLYSSTIYMLHYDPHHVSSSTLLILRRTNFINTASGIVTLCKQPYSMQVESGRIKELCINLVIWKSLNLLYLALSRLSVDLCRHLNFTAIVWRLNYPFFLWQLVSCLWRRETQISVSRSDAFYSTKFD
jgi:hypothetical protein